ncbi:MAG: ABC transporter permease [Candidatus Nanohaloarchaea archaeon]
MIHLDRYLSVLKITFKEASTYRLAAGMIVGSSLATLILYHAIWSSIAAAGTLNSSLSEVMTYLVMGQVVSTSAFLQTEIYIGELVEKGTVVNLLKRPVSFIGHTYMHEIGWVFFDSLTKAAPIAVIGGLAFSIGFPGPLRTGLFLVSLFFSFNLSFLMAYTTATLVFWTKSDAGIRMMRNIFISLFSGVLFPLYLLPEGLKEIFYSLPFAVMADGPIRIFMGRTSIEGAFRILGQQVIWMAVLAPFMLLMWRKAKTKITVQGG